MTTQPSVRPAVDFTIRFFPRAFVAILNPGNETGVTPTNSQTISGRMAKI